MSSVHSPRISSWQHYCGAQKVRPLKVRGFPRYIAPERHGCLLLPCRFHFDQNFHLIFWLKVNNDTVPHKHANVGPTMGQCWANHLQTIGATLGQRTIVHLPQHRANVGDIMPTSFQHWANVGQRLACQPYFWQLDNHRNAIFRICQRWPDVGAGGH